VIPAIRRRTGTVARTAVLTALAVAAGLALAAPAPAIIGGDPAAPGRWPSMAAILKASVPEAPWAQYCGGAVIGPRLVLTTAHCVVDAAPDEVDVLLGRTRLSETDGRRLHVTRIRVHPKYADGSARGLDAAVLTLAADAGVPPVRLAGPADAAAWAPGAPAWTMGWGELHVPRRNAPSYYADRLRELALPIVGDDACESAFGIGTRALPYRPAWSICAGEQGAGKGPCYGDSGGPLVVETPDGWLGVGILVGGDDCAAPGYYTLFTRVDRISAFALAPATAARPPTATRRTVGRRARSPLRAGARRGR
jgi:secreted trypsin-like serine protease